MKQQKQWFWFLRLYLLGLITLAIISFSLKGLISFL